MIRGKLISPTNVLLEQPILSPLDSPGFVIITKKEYKRHRLELIRYGVLIGLVSAVLAFAVLSYIAQVFR